MISSSLIVRIIAKLSVNTNALLDVIVLVFYIKKKNYLILSELTPNSRT